MIKREIEKVIYEKGLDRVFFTPRDVESWLFLKYNKPKYSVKQVGSVMRNLKCIIRVEEGEEDIVKKYKVKDKKEDV